MVGKTLGHYEILEPLGAGGMGEVYRARDTKLDRDVAIKVLAEDFAIDPDRLARLEREAKVLASLNHPNIAAVYGLEDEGDTRFIAMELVDGETLAEKLQAQGRLDVDEVLAIARQIAEGLEAAHESGVIHRDLKPANIIVTGDGKAKVLDFGLAKAYEADGSPAEISPDLSALPTVAAATRTGVILGTAAYMSPEQARGKPLDKRTDIWAFGCVLYEMLTGTRAFVGETVSDTLAAILKEQPDGAVLPDELAPSVRRVIGRCLDKDPRRRLRDIGDARAELESAIWGDTAPALGDATRIGHAARSLQDAPGAGARPTGLRGPVTAAIVAAAFGILGFWLGGAWAPDTPIVPSAVVRGTILLPPDQQIPRLMGAPLALSRDGARLAYAARDEMGVVHLFSRDMASGETTRLPGTRHADYPFFPPDGRWVGFSSAGRLRKVSVDGGGFPIELARTSGHVGASWGPDDRIVFTPASQGLWAIDANEGGEPEQLTVPDFAQNGYAHMWPQHLPGGRYVLFQMWSVPPKVLDLETLSWTTARPGEPGGDRYVPSGHLVYADTVGSGTVFAAPFDAGSHSAEGTGSVVLNDVRFLASQSAVPHMAVSDSGTAVYVASGLGAGELKWINPEGGGQVLYQTEDIIAGINLSPDGTRAVFGDERGNLWTMDMDRMAPEVLLQVGRDRANSPVWNPDGRSVTFGWNKTGDWDIYEMDVGGREEPRLLVSQPGWEAPSEWSANGEVLVHRRAGPETGFDVWVLPAGGEPLPVANSVYNEFSPVISPDGGLIAYVSDESGQHEVYVQTYPGGDFKVASTDGGEEPRWSHDGRELYFLRGYQMLAVTVTTDQGLEISRPDPLFEEKFARGSTNAFAPPYYDVAPDGRFLVVSDRPTTELQLILNWFEELKRLAPTAGSR